ncbi:MAG TPA: hypothetical protein VGF67_11670 [Ktedonobacteraceae bacterium]
MRTAHLCAPSSALTQAVPEQSGATISLILKPHELFFPAEGDFVQIERAGSKIFAHQEAAYQFLMNIVDYYGAQEAVFLQYSCTTGLPALRILLRKGARVTLFIQHEDTAKKIGSRFQAERSKHTIRSLRSDLGNVLSEPDALKIYTYRPPGSMSAIKIDERVLSMGWYTYEEKANGGHEVYLHDTLELSGHGRAAVVAWAGAGAGPGASGDFQRLCRTFRILEKNYREHAEVVAI